MVRLRTFDPITMKSEEQLFRPELFEETVIVDDDVYAGFVVVARRSPESRHLHWRL